MLRFVLNQQLHFPVTYSEELNTSFSCAVLWQHNFIFAVFQQHSSSFNEGVGPNLPNFAQGLQLFSCVLSSIPTLPAVGPSLTLSSRLTFRLYSNWYSSQPDNKILIIVLALWHGIYLFWQSIAFSLFPSLRGFTSQSHQQSRKPLSLLNGLTLWWKWLGLVRVCERRVTDGINHHNDGVRGVERGCRAVTDGTVCCWKERMYEKMWLIRQTVGIKAGNNGDVRDWGGEHWPQGVKVKEWNKMVWC